MNKVNWVSVIKSFLILVGMIGSCLLLVWLISLLTMDDVVMIIGVGGFCFLWYVVYDLIEWKRKIDK